MRHSATTLIITLAVLVGTLSLPALAQSNGNSGSSQSTTTQTTRTTETSQPTTVQVTREQTGINPLWLGLGALLLLAIVAIAAMAARGRSRDTATVVHERETVVKRD